MSDVHSCCVVIARMMLSHCRVYIWPLKCAERQASYYESRHRLCAVIVIDTLCAGYVFSTAICWSREQMMKVKLSVPLIKVTNEGDVSGDDKDGTKDLTARDGIFTNPYTL